MIVKLSIVLAGAMLAAAPSIAAVNLVQNGNFETTTLTQSSQFNGTQVANWTNAATSGYTGYGYNFLIKPNTADSTGFYSLGGNHDYVYGPNGNNTITLPNGTTTTNYANNGFTGTSPTGGNFLLMDGDTNFHGAVSQVISGLTVGQTYLVTFDWAGIAYGTTPGNTTQRFDVSLGNVTQSTQTLNVAPKGFSGWQSGGMTFTAAATSQTLSFLAQGTPNGLPPSLLLDNVQMGAVPEAASWAMMVAGFGAIGAAMRARRVRTVRFA